MGFIFEFTEATIRRFMEKPEERLAKEDARYKRIEAAAVQLKTEWFDRSTLPPGYWKEPSRNMQYQFKLQMPKVSGGRREAYPTSDPTSD